MVSASTAASSLSLLFGCLENLSKKTHIDYHTASMLLLRSFFFFFFGCLLLAWCLGGWESKGNIYIYIYIYSYFGMFSNYIHDFEFFFFFLIAWCLGVEKMWESKEK